MGTDASNPLVDSARANILIVDDHRMLADAMARALSSRGYSCRVADLRSASAVVEVAVAATPDLVLLDLDLGSIDGLGLIGPLRSRGLPVLVVTGCEDKGRLAAAVASGSVGWVSKSRPFEEVLEAVQLACRPGSLLAPKQHEALKTTGKHSIDSDAEIRSRIAMLTPRELEVLTCFVHGDNAQDIADHFVVSLGTVRTHIRSVLSKLGVSSQLAAAALAVDCVAAKRGLDREDLLAPLRMGT